MEDVVQNDNAEILMKIVVKDGLAGIKNGEVGLFKTYLCKFFFNNWRMKQIFSKPFSYS